jgi:cysteine synthase A
MTDRLSQLSPSTLHTIGSTPIVQLRKVVPQNSADVLVKLEYFNPTGSYKDRMALAMVEEAEKRGDLCPGMAVVEYTGGSTGSSLAFVCAVKGYTFKVVSSDAFAKEKLDTMRAFGAELEIITSPNGKITPDLIPRMIERAKTIAQADNTYSCHTPIDLWSHSRGPRLIKGMYPRASSGLKRRLASLALLTPQQSCEEFFD